MISCGVIGSPEFSESPTPVVSQGAPVGRVEPGNGRHCPVSGGTGRAEVVAFCGVVERHIGNHLQAGGGMQAVEYRLEPRHLFTGTTGPGRGGITGIGSEKPR